MKKFSNNKKLNSVLTEIYNSLMTMCDTKEESINEIKRYRKEFPYEIDFNIVQYGNLLIYYSDIFDLYKGLGCECNKWSNDKIWETYKRQVGYVVRNHIK